MWWTMRNCRNSCGSAFRAQELLRASPYVFEPPYRLAARPRFATDPALGDDETDFLETAWLRAYPPLETVDHWRVSPAGTRHDRSRLA